MDTRYRAYVIPFGFFVSPAGLKIRVAFFNQKDPYQDDRWAEKEEGTLNMFGGGIEGGEDPLEAVKRELGEELGVIGECIAQDGNFIKIPLPEGPTTVYAVDIGEISQERARSICKACEEGIAVPVSGRKFSKMAYTTPTAMAASSYLFTFLP